MEDKSMEKLPEEDELRPEPLTFREKVFLAGLIVVTALWTILLSKGLEWAVWWIKGVLG